MTATIGTLLVAHAAGKPLTATIEETCARIERRNDPALFIAIRPKPEVLAIAERLQAVAVVGAHLSGLPLNRELIELGAAFSREMEATADYRLFALTGSNPAKPGTLRVGEGAGAAIKAELWTLDRAGFGAFVAEIPAPVGIGTIGPKDGDSVKGFLVEVEAVKTAEDISCFGGWRAYLESR
jgi:hypothetical protein